MHIMLKKASLALVVIALGTSVTANAQSTGITLPGDPNEGVTRVGTRGLNFLELGVGARALALGGAYVSTAEGMSSIYWNPAGVSDLKTISASVNYQNLYSGVGLKNGYVAAGMPIGSGVVALALTHFSSGEIQRTTEQFPEGNDPNYGSTVEWIGTALTATYARRITDRLSFGGSFKYAQEGLDFVDASWVGVDLGTLFRTGLLASTVGISVSNLGGRARMAGPAIDRKLPATIRDPLFPTGRDLPSNFKTQNLQMPTIFRFGLRTELVGGTDALLSPNANHHVMWLTELSDPVDGPISPVFAFEYDYQQKFYVRGAKRFINENRAPFDFSDGLSAGAGLRLPALGRFITLDYAFETRDPLGSSQAFSVELGF
jgi:hypothetical protein